MKACVVFYSLTGNTGFAAKALAGRLDADVLELQTVKPYPQKGLAKFFHGGKAAISNAAPELMPYSFDADKYDVIVLGTPTWASRPAPPLRTFINENGEKLKGKRIFVYTCCGGGTEGAVKAGESVYSMLGIDAKEHGVFVLVDPMKSSSEENEQSLIRLCSNIENI